MNGKSRLCETPVFDMIMEILSHYQCPSNCQSFCCKMQNVDVDGEDWKILSKASTTKIENVKLIRYAGSLYHSIQPPCPFLLDVNKCGAYDRRPTICRIYPFNVDFENIGVKIYPCEIGMNILNDFFNFKKEKIGLDVPPKLLNDLKKSNEIFYSDIEDDSKILLVGMTLDELTPFGEYLRTIDKIT